MKRDLFCMKNIYGCERLINKFIGSYPGIKILDITPVILSFIRQFFLNPYLSVKSINKFFFNSFIFVFNMI